MLTLEPFAGDHISRTIDSAIEMANQNNDTVTFYFNETEVTVLPGSDRDDILQQWETRREERSRAYRASPEGIAAAREAEEQSRQYDAKMENRAARAERLGVGRDFKLLPPPFKIKTVEGIGGRIEEDPSPWEKTVKVNEKDAYSRAALLYAARWMVFMEDEMSRGKTVAEAAAATEYEADIEGITGFMQSCAASAIGYSWLHGDEFKQWREQH